MIDVIPAEVRIKQLARETIARELKRQIAALQKQQRVAAPATSAAELKAEYERGIAAGRRLEYNRTRPLVMSLAKYSGSLAGTIKAFADLEEPALPQRNKPIIVGVDPARGRDQTIFVHGSNMDPLPDKILVGKYEVRPRALHALERTEVNGITTPEQRILDSLAWFASIGIHQPENAAVAFLAGYTANGGAYRNPRGALRSKDLIAYLPGDCLTLTAAGGVKANHPDSVLTPEELHQRVLERLPTPEQKILRGVLEEYPNAVPNAALAAKAGYEESGGAYRNPRGRLRSLGLIEYVGGGVRARDILFLK